MSYSILSLELLVLFMLILCSAFFSGSETAFFSLRKWRVERLRRTGGRGAIISDLLSTPSSLIATILIGNETINVTASNLAAIIRRDHFSYFGTPGVIIALIVMSALLFFLGEMTPKVIAIYVQERWALIASIPMRYFFRIASPVRKIVEWISQGFDSLLPGAKRRVSDAVQIAELRSIVKESAGEAGLSSGEAKIIDSIFDMSERPVKSLMTPRTRIVAMNEDTPLDEALQTARTARFSRYPVYGEDIDDIRGTIYAKDLLAAQYALTDRETVREIARPAVLIPETKSAFNVLRDLQLNQIHLAVILDEYGGTAGIVTIDDILRGIVGDIGDRFKPILRRFEKITDSHFIVEGSISLQEFNELSGGRIADPDVETIAGYVMKMMGRIPSEGEEILIHPFMFRVSKMLGKRVAVIEVRRTERRDGKRDG